jgi:hypothetical protein
MSSIFNNLHLINDDNSDNTQRTVQNTEHANYMLNNFMGSNPFGGAMNVALGHQDVFVKGSGSMAIGGTNVAESSELLINQEQTRQRERLNIKPRMFNSVPFMGRGRVDTDTETAFLQSGDLPEKKSDIALSEQDYTSVRNYPLIQEIESKITNPNNLVEEAADSGWIRGGVPSRSLGHQQ